MRKANSNLRKDSYILTSDAAKRNSSITRMSTNVISNFGFSSNHLNITAFR